MISQKDFNKNLDSYISTVRDKEEIYPSKTKLKNQEVKPLENIDFDSYGGKESSVQKRSFLSWLFPKSNVDEEDFSDGVNIDIDEEGNVVQESPQELAEEYEELDEVEKKIEKRKSSLFARLFKRSSYPKRESDFDEGIELYDEQKESDQIIALKNDIKKLGIISYEVMIKLDSEELKRFKLSEEFADYKEILKKYNLIRVKF